MTRQHINYQSNSQYLKKLEEIEQMISQKRLQLMEIDEKLSPIEAYLQAIVQLMKEEKIPLITLG